MYFFENTIFKKNAEAEWCIQTQVELRKISGLNIYQSQKSERHSTYFYVRLNTRRQSLLLQCLARLCETFREKSYLQEYIHQQKVKLS